MHVRDYKEEGTTTTPFDMVVLNDLDRFHLVQDVIRRVPGLETRAGHVRQLMNDRLVEHKRYVATHGEDMPDVQNWRWGSGSATERTSRIDTAADFRFMALLILERGLEQPEVRPPRSRRSPSLYSRNESNWALANARPTNGGRSLTRRCGASSRIRDRLHSRR
jgi:hypothetical protein